MPSAPAAALAGGAATTRRSACAAIATFNLAGIDECCTGTCELHSHTTVAAITAKTGGRCRRTTGPSGAAGNGAAITAHATAGDYGTVATRAAATAAIDSRPVSACPAVSAGQRRSDTHINDRRTGAVTVVATSAAASAPITSGFTVLPNLSVGTARRAPDATTAEARH